MSSALHHTQKQVMLFQRHTSNRQFLFGLFCLTEREREREGGRGRQSAQSCGVIGRGGDVSLMLDVSVWAPLAAAPPRRLHERTSRPCHTHTTPHTHRP